MRILFNMFIHWLILFYFRHISETCQNASTCISDTIKEYKSSCVLPDSFISRHSNSEHKQCCCYIPSSVCMCKSCHISLRHHYLVVCCCRFAISVRLHRIVGALHKQNFRYQLNNAIRDGASNFHGDGPRGHFLQCWANQHRRTVLTRDACW